MCQELKIVQVKEMLWNKFERMTDSWAEKLTALFSNVSGILTRDYPIFFPPSVI